MKQRIVDALLSKFKTPSEIQKVINYLSDIDTRDSILEKLESSMYQHAIMKPEEKQKNDLKKKKEPLDTYLIDHICKILRNELLMSNIEVENWFKNKYGIQKNIGRSGLRTYLMQIMKSEGNEFLRKVLTDLSLMMRNQGKKDKELEKWWDEFEKRKVNV